MNLPYYVTHYFLCTCGSIGDTPFFYVRGLFMDSLTLFMIDLLAKT